MKLLSLFRKKQAVAYTPLWHTKVNGEDLCYNGEYIPDFMQKFDSLEDHVITQWGINKLSWNEYQRMVAEVQDARQKFLRFAYH